MKLNQAQYDLLQDQVNLKKASQDPILREIQRVKDELRRMESDLNEFKVNMFLLSFLLLIV